ncbi:MAG: Uncharacterized protein XD41_1655 [Desulfonauticus sp. 38_4375]|jgi:hypothetical protein|nr:MAG: Uncharacterized protein XD41_1655 [Desulfonauticus sp. 38_4375]
MQINWELFFSALGLAFVFEGLPYFLWAEKMPSYLSFLAKQPPQSLRKMGLISILIGLLIVYLTRG